MKREWFVVATSRADYQHSREGPFPDAAAAGIWADENRLVQEWQQVSIQSNVTK